MGCFLLSLDYFEDKPKIAKRQPHKRKDQKNVKKENSKIIFERFLEFKVKQNLRIGTINKFILTFNNIEMFHGTRTDRPFYLTDITTEFISDWVYWLKNEAIRFDGHKYKPQSAQTVGLSDATIETRIKNLKTFIKWAVKQDLIAKNPFDKFEGFIKTPITLIFSLVMN